MSTSSLSKRRLHGEGAQVTSSGVPSLVTANYVVKEAGYAYIYISNEQPTQTDVYFDDVTMKYTPGNVIQQNEYYPFGLQTATSWTRDNTTNNFLGNGGTELNGTTQLYDLEFRNFDPILGRLHQIDPMADTYSSHTPYNFAFNNPANLNDVNGADPLSSSYKPILSHWSADFDENYQGADYGAARSAARARAHIASLGGQYQYMGGLSEGYNGKFNLADLRFGFGFGDLPHYEYEKVGEVEVGGYTTDKYDWVEQTDINIGDKFFTNEADAYKYMWKNSFGPDGKTVWREVAALITNKGILVLPWVGVRHKSGEIVVNDPRHSWTDVLPISGKGKNLVVEYMGKTYNVLGQIHTHPNEQPFGESEVKKDLRVQSYLGVPIYIIRTDALYDLNRSYLGARDSYFNGTNKLIK